MAPAPGRRPCQDEATVAIAGNGVHCLSCYPIAMRPFAIAPYFRFMRNPLVWFVVIVIAAVGGGFYFWKAHTDREARLEQVPPQQTSGVAEVTPPAATAESE